MASTDQVGYDTGRFESIVDQNFHCLICSKVLKDPVMCRTNEHHFCRGCITEHLRENSHTCPKCGDELSAETLQDVSRIVKNYLNELSIRCDHYDRGCRELVQLQHLKRHIDECVFTPVVCGNQGCGETINKRDRTYHESELCQFRKLKCHNCGKISTMMAGMDTKIANLETKIANLDTKTAHINTNQANTNTNITTMKTEIENVNTKLENINTKMENMEAKFEAMNEVKMSLSEVKDGFDHLKEAILEKIESNERRQEEITRDVSGTASGGREYRRIFVAGGGGEDSVEMFDCRQRVWSLLNPMPVERYSTSLFVYNDDVTVAGGFCPGGAVDNMIQMKIHPVPDLSNNWSDFAAKLPARMYGHSSVVYKDSLLVTGGYNHGVISDCIHEVQLKSPHTVKCPNQEPIKMPESRAYHSTVLCDDSILIFGGRKSQNYKDTLSSVLSYDITKNECRPLPALPYPVSEMATVKWSENVVIIGGVDKDGKPLNNVIIYNIKTGNSYPLPPMLHEREGCMAVVVENTIVVLGGADEIGDGLKSVESFNFEQFSWEELPDMKETRYLANAVVI